MTFSRVLSWGSLAFLVVSSLAISMEIDPAVIKALRANSNDKILSVIVNLDGQLDLNSMKHFTGTEAQKGKEIAKQLEAFNSSSSSPLLKFFKTANLSGLKEITPIWITNSVRIRGTSDVIQKLLSMNSLESIVMDAPKPVSEFDDKPAGTLEPKSALPKSLNGETEAPAKVSWGSTKVRAPELWAQGITGKGITVAMIDSGANLKHPDLIPNLWQNVGETGLDANGKDRATNGVDDDNNGYIDDVVGWNFEGKNNDPTDKEGHGSQTAGIVGGMGAGGTQTGVAPGVKLMIIRSCCDAGTQIFESNTWEAMQYAIKNGARVISMSLSVKHPSNPSYAKWRRAGEVMLAAGVVHVNSAGNRGSDFTPHNVGAPASNPPAWAYPKQVNLTGLTSMITIGATDESDKLRYYSSVGPVTWEDIVEYKDFAYTGGKSGLVRPDVCGPSEVPSLSMTGATYTASFGGTSSATPNVAGVVALLLSAKPNLTVAQVTETLQMSAVQVENSFNNKCGAGRVDAVAAVEYAKAKF